MELELSFRISATLALDFWYVWIQIWILRIFFPEGQMFRSGIEHLASKMSSLLNKLFFWIRFSNVFPSGCRIPSFLTWTSDSSSKTVYWKGLESQILMKIRQHYSYIRFVFISSWGYYVLHIFLIRWRHTIRNGTFGCESLRIP